MGFTYKDHGKLPLPGKICVSGRDAELLWVSNNTISIRRSVTNVKTCLHMPDTLSL
jgi:hypothetical protein